MNEQQANALFQQSVSLLQQGQHQEALKILSKLDQAIPSNPGILFFTATGHSIAGNKRKAIQIYERVLRLNPQFIEAYNNTALDLAYLGEHQQAIGFIDRALAIRPNFIEAIVNKGCCLNALSEYSAACTCFESALRINPNNAEALANLGIALIRLGQYPRARELSERVLQLNPSDYKGHSNLGKISMALEMFGDALTHFIAASQCRPNDPDNLSDLGNAHAKLDQHDEARQHFEQALSINPSHGATHLHLGLMHHDLRNFDQALAYFNAPIEDKYRLTSREYNRALTYLHQGRLQEGWTSYEWRWKESDLPVPTLHTTRPYWEGQQTDGTVLLWHEQGIGDQILFGSLFHDAATLAPNLLIRLDHRLIPLFQRSFPTLRFIAQDAQLADGDFEYHLPIGDLPKLFRHKREAFNLQAVAYLKAESHRTTQLTGILPTGTTIVGLAWATKGKSSIERNLPIENVVATIQNAQPSTLVDLQYTDTTEDRARISQSQGVEVLHLDSIDNFNDLDGLAALIAACDFVVTCSNSTAHLAGALGKETYLLVPFGRGRHWYWSHIGENSQSLWYPSIRVIPQTVAGDWTQPTQALMQHIKNRPKSDR